MKNIFIAILILLSLSAFAQDKNEKIGIPEELKIGSNYFNYGDKNKVNIDVFVWGSIRAPGKYLVPQGTTLMELLSLCGGPDKESKLEDIRIVRLKNDTLGVKEDKVMTFDYNEFLWEKQITKPGKINPVLYPGDMIMIPNSPKFNFRDNLYLILGITTTLVSIATLIITVTKY
jgi:SLBB domain